MSIINVQTSWFWNYNGLVLDIGLNTFVCLI